MSVARCYRLNLFLASESRSIMLLFNRDPVSPPAHAEPTSPRSSLDGERSVSQPQRPGKAIRQLWAKRGVWDEDTEALAARKDREPARPPKPTRRASAPPPPSENLLEESGEQSDTGFPSAPALFVPVTVASSEVTVDYSNDGKWGCCGENLLRQFLDMDDGEEFGDLKEMICCGTRGCPRNIPPLQTEISVELEYTDKRSKAKSVAGSNPRWSLESASTLVELDDDKDLLEYDDDDDLPEHDDTHDPPPFADILAKPSPPPDANDDSDTQTIAASNPRWSSDSASTLVDFGSAEQVGELMAEQLGLQLKLHDWIEPIQ